LNKRIESRHFDTAETKRALPKQGQNIATRVTKSGACEYRPRQGQGSRAERELVVIEKKEEVEVEGETAMDLYMTLGPL
jgi:hypothetical protein